MSRDYYSVLGVDKNATDSQIKKKYKDLAIKYHPDRNKNNKSATEKFLEIQKAYDVLKDPQKRQAYDSMGHDAFEGIGGSQGGGRGGANPFGGFGGGGSSEGFEDFFSSFFGDDFGFGGSRSRKNSMASNGHDLYDEIYLTLEEAYKGKIVQVDYNTYVFCKSCSGTGSTDSQYQKCSHCNGSGNIRSQQGMFVVSRTCNYCGGSGKNIASKCGKCAGEGRYKDKVSIEIKIPQGISDGQQVRADSKGEAGRRGGRSGDFYLKIGVKNHELYSRKGEDLYTKIPVKLTSALLGDNIKIPSIDGGVIEFKINPCTQCGKKIKISGKGMPLLGSGARRGDVIIEIDVEIPVKLSKRQIEIIKQFDGESKEGNSPNSEGFLKRIKKFFQI